MSGKILVTGAGGFIGRAVVERLARDGIPVRAALHRPTSAKTPGVETVRCDLDVPDEVAAACHGAEVIIHAAGRETATMAVHLRTLLDAAGRAGVERFVLFSSIAVYGSRKGIVREDDPPRALDSYGSAKRACEALLRIWVAEGAGRRRAVVLRPGVVYGRGSDLWIERPLAALQAGVLGTLGRRGNGLAPLIHVTDVAEATHAAVSFLDGAGPAETVLNLVGPETPTWNGYISGLSHLRNQRPPRRIGWVRLSVLRLAAGPAKILARLGVPVPAALRLVPASGELRLFARVVRYDGRRAAEVIGFTPRIGIVQGLALSFSTRESDADRLMGTIMAHGPVSEPVAA